MQTVLGGCRIALLFSGHAHMRDEVGVCVSLGSEDKVPASLTSIQAPIAEDLQKLNENLKNVSGCATPVSPCVCCIESGHHRRTCSLLARRKRLVLA